MSRVLTVRTKTGMPLKTWRPFCITFCWSVWFQWKLYREPPGILGIFKKDTPIHDMGVVICRSWIEIMPHVSEYNIHYYVCLPRIYRRAQRRMIKSRHFHTPLTTETLTIATHEARCHICLFTNVLVKMATRLWEINALSFVTINRILELVLFYWLNLLKPNGHVMYQQFNIQQLYALPTLYLCVLYLSENKQRLVPLKA